MNAGSKSIWPGMSISNRAPIRFDLIRLVIPFGLSAARPTSDTVIKLDLHQAIVDAIIQSDGDAAFKACQGAAHQIVITR